MVCPWVASSEDTYADDEYEDEDKAFGAGYDECSVNVDADPQTCPSKPSSASASAAASQKAAPSQIDALVDDMLEYEAFAQNIEEWENPQYSDPNCLDCMVFFILEEYERIHILYPPPIPRFKLSELYGVLHLR